MQSAPELDPPRTGLRERKKLKTRAAIQEHALRLFREQGYYATTVDQIAEAAEVSPSTFFRYFPTKEDVALYDPMDPALFEAFRAQPQELGPIGALRAAMRHVFVTAPAQEMTQQLQRAALVVEVPELRMRMLDELAKSMRMFAEAIAERVGREPDDVAVTTMAGAVIGVGMGAWFRVTGSLSEDYLKLLDDGLAQLEAGLPF